MALVTFGTNAATTLQAFQWTRSPTAANVALINNAMKTQGTVQRLVGGFAFNGILMIPNRGDIRLVSGDWIAISSTGMPIVVSNLAKLADFTSGS